MATIDESENRVRELSSDVEGEKAVTRQVYAQAVRNGDQIGALRSEVATGRVDIQNMTSRIHHMVTEVVQGTAMLRSHGLRLEALTRDVGLLRNDLTALRRGQEELHVRVDQVQADVVARVDQLRADVAARVDELRADVTARVDELRVDVTARVDQVRADVVARVDQLRAAVTARLDRQDNRFEAMERNIAAILAAVVPGTPRRPDRSLRLL